MLRSPTTTPSTHRAILRSPTTTPSTHVVPACYPCRIGAYSVIQNYVQSTYCPYTAMWNWCILSSQYSSTTFLQLRTTGTVVRSTVEQAILLVVLVQRFYNYVLPVLQYVVRRAGHPLQYQYYISTTTYYRYCSTQFKRGNDHSHSSVCTKRSVHFYVLFPAVVS